MRVSTPVINHIAVGAARQIPDLGDAEPIIPQVITPTIETLTYTNVLGAASNVEADNSLVVSVRTNIPASTGAAVTTVATLRKGLYTLDFHICARTVGTPAASGIPDIRIEIVDEALTQAVDLLTLFAFNNVVQNCQRRMRVCLPATFLIRRRTEATGVGQTMEIGQSFSIERHL